MLTNLKKYKHALMIFAGIILFITIYILFFGEQVKDAILPPVIKTPQQPRVEQEVNTFDYLGAIPPTKETVKTIDPYFGITFKFEEEIDAESAVIIVKPYLDIIKVVPEEDPKSLYIQPDFQPWRDRTKYYITIRTLKAKNGKVLRKPVEYIYYSELETTIPGGIPGIGI